RGAGPRFMHGHRGRSLPITYGCAVACVLLVCYLGPWIVMPEPLGEETRFYLAHSIFFALVCAHVVAFMAFHGPRCRADFEEIRRGGLLAGPIPYDRLRDRIWKVPRGAQALWIMLGVFIAVVAVGFEEHKSLPRLTAGVWDTWAFDLFMTVEVCVF